MGETPPPQDAEVSLNFLIGSEVVLMCGLQTDREKAPSPRPPAKSNPTVTQSSAFRKPAVPSSAPSFSQPNSGHHVPVKHTPRPPRRRLRPPRPRGRETGEETASAYRPQRSRDSRRRWWRHGRLGVRHRHRGRRRVTCCPALPGLQLIATSCRNRGLRSCRSSLRGTQLTGAVGRIWGKVS